MHILTSSYTRTSKPPLEAASVLVCVLIYGSETPALQQKRDESMTERVVRAVNHCRTALLAGYTTYRYVLSVSNSKMY
jgi:hypothetical protein